MKLEINVPAPFKGTVHSVYVKSGSKCDLGDLILTFRKDGETTTTTKAIQSTMPQPSSSKMPVVKEANVGDLSIQHLHRCYFKDGVSVEDVMRKLLQKIRASTAQHPYVFISVRSEESLIGDALRLDALSDAEKHAMPLFGIPFACKDNIDCEGLPTSCACPDFAFEPSEDATVVALLRRAGAIVMGKTNMDQFAAGLVGVRSPHGACRSVFNPEYVSGGSSSGSAVAVAAKLATFSLGTDTAGSGRVPAMFNRLVGLKPTRGLFSIKGVVPACQSLDCVSIFATTVEDAAHVKEVLATFDPADPYSRPSPFPTNSIVEKVFKFGVPNKLEFFDDAEAPRAFRRAVERLEAMGGVAVPIDFSNFTATANLLYHGPWVAERLEAIEEFVKTKSESMHPVTKGILTGGSKYTAVETFRALHSLESLKRACSSALSGVSCLLVPTAPRHYKVADVEQNPIQLNTNLGTYTNFANLLDLCALAVPVDIVSKDKMPYGVTFIAPAFQDDMLVSLARRFERTLPVDLAVVGAHLSGMPLNYQLTERGATFVRKTKTALNMYKLYALNELKPGMVRVSDGEATGDNIAIEVEIWRFPTLDGFGSFVTEIPTPLGVGTIDVEAEGGEGTQQVKSFLCESYAVKGAKDISHYGGWRAFKADVNKV